MAVKPREDLSDRITRTQNGVEVRLTQATIVDVVEKMVDHYLRIDTGDKTSAGDYLILRRIDWTLNALRNYYGSNSGQRDGLAETIAKAVDGYLPTYE